MKKLYFTTLILLAFALNGMAQITYYPLVHEDDDQQWNVLYITEPYHYTWNTEIQFIEGDSIIDGIAYRQVWRKDSYDTGLRLKGFLREESKRVYYRQLSNDGLEEEVLLYDFNLMVGDTVTVNWGNTMLLVLEESEVEVDGTMRRQLGLGNPDNGVSPFNEVDEYWIEGVGSTHGFLNSGHEPWSWFGSFDHLLCYYENDNLIWDNEEFDECEMNNDIVTFFDEASGLNFNITGENTVEVTCREMYSGYNLYVDDIVIPETVTYKGITFTVTAVGDRAFANSQGLLTSVIVPNTVTTIGELAFASCPYLHTVVLPNSVKVVGNKTFMACPSLTSVQLPVGINNLPNEMFYSCFGLASIVIPPTVIRIEDLVFAETGLTTIDIPESVTYIGVDAFSLCDRLIDVNIPNSVTELGEGTFHSCRQLQSVHLPENLQVIPASLLSGCYNLTSVTFPETLSEIGDYAFFDCCRLTEIELPNSVTSLGTAAFQFCGELEAINIPKTVNHLGKNLFRDCRRLRSVVLPQGIDTIPQGLFACCIQLDSVIIPQSVVWIGENAFQRYSEGVRLTLICHGTTPAECSPNSFPEVVHQEMVITPCGFEDVYREAWGDYWQSGNFEENCNVVDSEWYYEILNDDGSITYQYLQHTSDTTVQDEPVQIIVKINTLYDKGEHVDKSYEYIYERDGKVYWWNKTLEEFTVLYDYNAIVGDEWEIKVGTQSLVMHVDAVELYEYEGRQYKILQVSDEGNLFSGMIVCGIGHLTSFFPEKLINQGKGYRVEGIRCFWQNGGLVFKYGDRDCDEVYEEFHDYGMDEPAMAEGFKVYPNPTDGVITISSAKGTEYRITNLMGQTLMTGQINGENQQIDVSTLPQGMYFITIAGETQKCVVQ